jgi:uncharacterized membrane protein YphA (DoxX/SURF4 family)
MDLLSDPEEVVMVVRRLARPLLAAVFVVDGVDALRAPDRRVKQAEPVAARLRDLSPLPLPPGAVDVVRADAGVKIAAGGLLALGRVPRLAAAALAAVLVPTTLSEHRYWEVGDPARRADERVAFLKNIGLLGGLLVAAADTGGRPSLPWRVRHAARSAVRGVSHGTQRAAGAVGDRIGRG